MKVRFLLVVLVGILLVAGCSKKNTAPEATKEPVTVQPQNLALGDPRTVALQDFQSFRTANSLAVALKSYSAMEQKLGAAGLSHRDLSLDDNEILGVFRDLARRKPARPAKPTVAMHKPRHARPHHR
jgi:hypothetical protein